MTGATDALARALRRARQPEAANVFLQSGDSQAEVCARQLDSQLAADFELGGEVVVIKGNIDIGGLPTTAGTKTFAPAAAQSSAPLVDKIVAAGGVPLGHANMSEFAYSGLGLNPHFGTPANGLDPALVPGGSSSGCASAIALGIADLAVGSDTSGSTRVPAAYQGIYGFRPTMGRYDNEGILPLASSLDTAGPMARDLAGICKLDRILANRSEQAGTNPRPVLIPNIECLGPLSEDISELLMQARKALIAAGHQVDMISVPVFEHLGNLFAQEGTLVAAEAPAILEQFTPLDHPALDLNVRRRIAQALPVDPDKLLRLTHARARLQKCMHEMLDEALLLMPTVPAPPPRLDAVQYDADRFAEENARALSLTMLGAVLDLPSLAMPASGRVPGYSLTLCAQAGRDKAVLDTAKQMAPLFMSLKM